MEGGKAPLKAEVLWRFSHPKVNGGYQVLHQVADGLLEDTFTPTFGDFLIASVKVTDADGQTVVRTAECVLKGVTHDKPACLSIDKSTVPALATAGEPVTVGWTLTDAVKPYTIHYRWRFTAVGKEETDLNGWQETTGDSATVTPPAEGVMTLECRYTDARGESYDYDALHTVMFRVGPAKEKPTATPTAAPTAKPTATPTVKPTATPTVKPTEQPTVKLTEQPTVAPNTQPTAVPTANPTVKPMEKPTAAPVQAESQITVFNGQQQSVSYKLSDEVLQNGEKALVIRVEKAQNSAAETELNVKLPKALAAALKNRGAAHLMLRAEDIEVSIAVADLQKAAADSVVLKLERLDAAAPDAWKPMGQGTNPAYRVTVQGLSKDSMVQVSLHAQGMSGLSLAAMRDAQETYPKTTETRRQDGSVWAVGSLMNGAMVTLVKK